MERKNIIEFPKPPNGWVNPDEVLGAAIGNVKNVVVIGVTYDDEFYIAGSDGDIKHVNFMLDLCKQRILDFEFER